jgi:hypothetical protein
MANVFDTIITQGVRAGQIPARTDAARTWYRNAAAGKSRINERKMMREAERLTSKIFPGSMYMFFYDPKYKDTLPFYDRFPLIFPFRVESDRFWGINLHYLNLQHRAVLMDGLYDLSNNNRYDETTKLRLSYSMLNRAAKFRYFKPCVKQYLFDQTQSRFMYIYPSEWDIALFLPTERFQKATKGSVHSQSSLQVQSGS